MRLKEQFEEGWWQKLSPFLHSEEFKVIASQLGREIALGKKVTPLFDHTFRAFKECPYKDLKVVILGLDPYPQPNTADGLAFSARYNPYNPPKSLEYIINAMEKDVYGGFGIGYNEEYCNPDLTRWAEQGVLLLNCALSTIVGKTGVHLDIWRPFIREVFRILNENNTGLIYIFVGNEAKLWKSLVNQNLNTVLTTVHPSYCNYRGLKDWDCNKIFSITNDILEKTNGYEAKILW